MSDHYLIAAIFIFVISMLIGIFLNELGVGDYAADPVSIIFWSVIIAVVWPLVLGVIPITIAVGLAYWLLLKLVRLTIRMAKWVARKVYPEPK